MSPSILLHSQLLAQETRRGAPTRGAEIQPEDLDALYP